MRTFAASLEPDTSLSSIFATSFSSSLRFEPDAFSASRSSSRIFAMRLDASGLGMSLPNTPPEDARRFLAAIGAGLENGTLRPLVGRELPLAAAAQAHQAVMDQGAIGKIVLVA